MTKGELLGSYQTKMNHIQLSYASLVLWSYDDVRSFFEQLHGELDDNIKVFPSVINLVKDKTNMRIALEDLYQSAYRSAVVELCSLTKLYCRQTGQLQCLKAQPWFQFLLVIRNCWSHDMTFNLNPNEKSKLPLTWSGITLDESINGKSLTHGDLSYKKLYELLQTGQKYVQQLA